MVKDKAKAKTKTKHKARTKDKDKENKDVTKAKTGLRRIPTWPKVHFTELQRKLLAGCLASLNLLALVSALVLTGAGLYLKKMVSDYQLLIDDYDASILPYTVVAIGLACFVFNGVGIILFLASRKDKRSKRKKITVVLYAYLVLHFIVSLVILSSSLMCFAHTNELRDAFHDGITGAMKKYKHEQIVKTAVDELQMKLECCGTVSYKDWFRVKWENPGFLRDKLKRRGRKRWVQHESKYLKPGQSSVNVPFSCCSRQSPRPCIHYLVEIDQLHYNYDYRVHLTLNSKGCKTTLMEHFGVILVGMGSGILIVFVIQISICLLGRCLQTSLSYALVHGKDHTDRAPGWLIGYMPTPEHPARKSRSDKDSSDSDEAQPMLKSQSAKKNRNRKVKGHSGAAGDMDDSNTVSTK